MWSYQSSLAACLSIMITAFIKKLYEQLLLLFVVTLIAMAAYVSLGRQFMPAVSGYKSFLEEQIALRAGLPVTIGSVAVSYTHLTLPTKA